MRRLSCGAVVVGLGAFGTIGCSGSAARSDGGAHDAPTIFDAPTAVDAAKRDAAGDAFVTTPLPGSAVAYQIDVAHTGYQPTTKITPPLKRQWSVDLGGAVSYPLIVGGQVFVTVGDDTTFNGGKLVVLDLATGAPTWGPIAVPAMQIWLNAAYDQGRVYVLNFDGRLAAFDAVAGTPLWAVSLPGQYAFQSSPAATGGMVFVDGDGSGNTAYAVDGATGVIKWTRQEPGGDHASPAVSPDGVFIAYGCAGVDALNPLDGTRLWLNDGACLEGPGVTAALYDARLWARDHNGTNQTIAVATGAALGDFAAEAIPAFHEHQGFFLLSDGTLQARDIDSGVVAWSFVGDGTLVTAPIVANSAVYVGGSSGNIYAVDEVTGAMRWSDAAGTEISALTEFTPQPLNGLAVGGDSLVVPAGHLLVCYR